MENPTLNRLLAAKQKATPKPVAKARPAKPAFDPKASWTKAIQAAMVRCGGDGRKAVALVAAERPQLRAAYVASANAQPKQPKPVAIGSRVAFDEMIKRLTEDEGLTKSQAMQKITKEYPELLSSWIRQANRGR